MLHSVNSSLRIRSPSPEFFSSGQGKGLCEGLLTHEVYNHKEFDLQKYFYQYPVIQCLSHSAVKLLLIRFILSEEPWLTEETFMMRTMNPNTSVILIHMSMLKTPNQTRMNIITIRENNHHCHYNKNRLRSGDHHLRLIRHVSISLQAVIDERSRIKHST